MAPSDFVVLQSLDSYGDCSRFNLVIVLVFLSLLCASLLRI